MIKQISLRQEVSSDKSFLSDLYMESRDYELQNAQVDAMVLKVFMQSQFKLQSRHFDDTIPELKKQIIVCNGEPVGRLYTVYKEQESKLHLVDITVLRNFRKNGIATHLINQLQKSLTPQCPVLSLYVVAQNPARYFYIHHGFVEKSQRENHIYMEYLAATWSGVGKQNTILEYNLSENI